MICDVADDLLGRDPREADIEVSGEPPCGVSEEAHGRMRFPKAPVEALGECLQARLVFLLSRCGEFARGAESDDERRRQGSRSQSSFL